MPASLTSCGVDPANTHYAFSDGLDIELNSSLPEDIGRLQGVWCGTWGGYIPQVLVIDGVRSDCTARFVYAWGDSIHGVKRSKEGQLNLRDSPLTIEFPKGIVEFNMVPPERLFGIYKERDTIRNCVTLSRIVDADGSDSVSVEHLRVPADACVESLKDTTLSLYCTVYRDTRRASAPLLLLNHGSAGGSLGPAVTWLYDAQARYFVSRGFAVVVPMRRGRGKSDGPFIETANHDTVDFSKVELSAGVADLLAILHHLRAKLWASENPCILAGQSRGGFLSLVSAAKAPDRIRAVVNFSGGWWHEESDAASFQIRKLQETGAELRVPTIWLYGGNDYFYGPTHIREMHDAFTDAGGMGDLHIFGPIGHELIDHMHVWQEAVDAFIDSLN